MKTDLVSIITPTYNCGRFIAETIESVQAQTYTNWEMIIIDDCSTDHTDEIVAMYSERDSRIKYHCLKRNSGAAIARNTALRMAVGRWIAFLDSDDLWHPEKLERQVKFMIDNMRLHILKTATLMRMAKNWGSSVSVQSESLVAECIIIAGSGA